jgi:uncharacterized membrane protein YecN with MAPEG domain
MSILSGPTPAIVLLPSLVTALTVLLQMGVMMNVARARARYRVEPPATTGAPEFERAYRIQVNTVEATLMFLPSLWMFGQYVSPLFAGALGLIWLAGRVAYAVGYQRAARRRTAGFVVSGIALLLLAIGAAAGVLRAMFLIR